MLRLVVYLFFIINIIPMKAGYARLFLVHEDVEIRIRKAGGGFCLDPNDAGDRNRLSLRVYDAARETFGDEFDEKAFGEVAIDYIMHGRRVIEALASDSSEPAAASADSSSG